MKGLTKLALALLLVLLLSLLGLLAGVISVVWFRRRRRRSSPEADVEAAPKVMSSFVGCWRSSSKVEPAAEGAEPMAMMWTAACYGPSRLLYTIKEEEEEREASETEVQLAAAGEDDAVEFSTPCASPEFFTPAPSPARSC
ncbi:hypothetical protein J5N97_012155 [Dioscorea zingiberensis]|uniref:Uncharacterized protein n=1 Tax=Dioscorea zingiberensis TaxID=325984 RepID=A0A9D5HHF4_9LILI|nr:hypothetical protein J5N97_012155 [Dioscorea zingiberensis]